MPLVGKHLARIAFDDDGERAYLAQDFVFKSVGPTLKKAARD
jgi:hypothetical protein